MPNELESYAVTLVKSMLGTKDLPADATDEQRASAHRRQAEMLIELFRFLLDHYLIAGYSGTILSLALLRAVRVWTSEHLTKTTRHS